MTTIIDNEILWRQFTVTIDSFRQALSNCPDELWEKQLWADEPDQWVAKGFSAYWYFCYHTLFWLDPYLTGAEEGFTPPAPFDLVGMEPNEVLPRNYTRQELLGYLAHCCQRGQKTIGTLPIEQAYRICQFPWGGGAIC